MSVFKKDSGDLPEQYLNPSLSNHFQANLANFRKVIYAFYAQS